MFHVVEYEQLWFRGLVVEAEEDALEVASIAGETVSEPQEEIKIRHNFPETWIWDSIESGYEI